MSKRTGPSLWEQVAREAAGPDNQPCSDWQPNPKLPRHCAGCGWGHDVHHRDHAAREIEDALSGLADETVARLLYGDDR
jgi:hypothetical protein